MTRKKYSITIARACEGMLRQRLAEGKSLNTFKDYENTFKKLTLFFPENLAIESITKEDLVRFFTWLQQDYESEPDGVAPRGKFKLSQKSILNIHTNLSSLWSWAAGEHLVDSNIVREIKLTKPPVPVIEPFTKVDWQKLLMACRHTRTWKSREATKSERSTAERDIAILCTLHDTGARASELCSLQYQDFNMANKTLKLRGKGPGREPKERIVPIGKMTADALNRFLRPRLDRIGDASPLFAVGNDVDERPFTRDHLGKHLKRIGDRAGVPGVHPHRFRHTFAINFLRNDGNMFALQAMLGHTTLDMVKRYLQIVQIDLVREQQRSSPVDNWK